MAEKTISGAMYSAPNLEHNIRAHIPPNSVEERRNRNLIYTEDEDITLQQVYQKLFADAYKEWREREIKKGRGKRFPETYYEKIELDKQKHLCYEIIWQIGDMRDTGFCFKPEDAEKAQDLLDQFARYLLDLPEVCVVTKKELEDPNWKPPFEAGLIVHHMVYHGDENSPHIHMTYIPYTTHSARGAPVQNAFAQTFKDLGYPTTMSQAVTESGEMVWQRDENGNLKPQMKRNSYGGADWVETQKSVLQEMMFREFGWERFYKGSNPRGNLLLSDYRREKAAEIAKAEKQKLEELKDEELDVQTTIWAKSTHLKELQAKLSKGIEVERQLSTDISEKKAELDEINKDLTDKKGEIKKQETKLEVIKLNAEVIEKEARLAEGLVEHFKDIQASEREYEYFEKMLDLAYENENLKRSNEELKSENRTLKAKLEKAYDYMKQFTIGGVNMLEQFLRSFGEWVQQRVASLSR